MFKSILDKISNIIHKERNIKLKEIQRYLDSVNIKVNIYPREKVIEFNKKEITSTYCTADYFEYHFDGEVLTFTGKFYDHQGWLKSLMNSTYNTPLINNAYETMLSKHIPHKSGMIFNECMRLELMKEDYFVVQITKDSFTIMSHYTAKKNNAVNFYIEMLISFDKNKITTKYAPDGSNVDKEIEVDNNFLEGMLNELTGQYVIHFLNDYAKREILGLSETNPYNPEIHSELIKMYTI